LGVEGESGPDSNEVEVIDNSKDGVEEVEEIPGWLVPIENVAPDQEIWENERKFRRDRVTEDVNPVLAYPEPPEYIEPPQYLEPSVD